MKNYEKDLADVMKAAAKVADKFQNGNEQAVKECNDQGFKFVSITKDNRKFNARFLFNNEERKMQIIKRKKGMLIRISIPDGILPRT